MYSVFKNHLEHEFSIEIQKNIQCPALKSVQNEMEVNFDYGKCFSFIY